MKYILVETYPQAAGMMSGKPEVGSNLRHAYQLARKTKQWYVDNGWTPSGDIRRKRAYSFDKPYILDRTLHAYLEIKPAVDECFNCKFPVHDENVLVEYDRYCDECTEKLLLECANCGEWTTEKETILPEGSYYRHDAICMACYEDHYSFCAHCENLYKHENMESILNPGTIRHLQYYGDVLIVCEWCADDLSEKCDNCRERKTDDELTPIRNAFGHESHYCEECREEDHTHCTECDEWKHKTVYNDKHMACYDCKPPREFAL